MAQTVVGRIWLMDAAGRITNTVSYDVPVKLREPVLHIAGGRYDAMRQEPDGTWVYRYTGLAPTQQTDAYLSDMRNDQHPEWDGPVTATVLASTESLRHHFEHLRHLAMHRNYGLSNREFQQLYEHFIATQKREPYSWM